MVTFSSSSRNRPPPLLGHVKGVHSRSSAVAHLPRVPQHHLTGPEAARSGFVCAPHTLRTDPWLASVRAHPDFAGLLAQSEMLTREA